MGPDDLLLHELCNQFLAAKKVAVERREIIQRTWDEYLESCQRLCRVFGRETPVVHLVPADFQRLRSDMAKTWGPVRIGNEIQRCRCVFRYGLAQDLLPRLPTYGDGFRRPTKKMLRKNRAEKGLRMFEAEQLRQLLEKAAPLLRAMILLAVNCGYGNHDVATVSRKHCDLKTGWVNFPRPKTGIDRRAKLWPETVRAIRKVLRLRDRRLKAETKAPAAETPAAVPESTSSTPETPAVIPETAAAITPYTRRRYKRLIFLTRGLKPWTAKTGSPISQEFGRLLRRCGLNRPGLNFYALRHTFQTIAGDTKDQPAVSAVMGHAARSDDMSAVYTERITDDRLAAVAEHVRAWLFPAK